jgi:hypothetical protein
MSVPIKVFYANRRHKGSRADPLREKTAVLAVHALSYSRFRATEEIEKRRLKTRA